MKSLKIILCTIMIFVSLIISSCSKKETNDVVPVKSSAKVIMSFSFSELNPVVNAVISESSKTISAIVPAGTNLSSLSPTIIVSGKASVNPVSGVTQDFSKQVDYTVTAEDGTSQLYKVTVTIAPAITQVLDCNNLPAVLTDRGDGVDYSVGCNIQLTNNQVLTVNPGATIRFEATSAGITITKGAALKMIGTALKPIVLMGKTDTQGAWTGVQIDSKNTDNQWQYVILKNAGGGANPAGLLIADDAYFLHNTQISIKNCTFTNNNGYGIWDVDNGFKYSRTVFTDFENNTFTQNSKAPLNITIDGIGKLDTKSSYTGNVQNYIEVHGTYGLYNNTNVQKLNVPYLIIGSIGLHQRMNVSPGVIFQFYVDAGFNLDAQYMGAGTFIANGTAANPISFVGYKTGKGVWLGLSLGNNDPEISMSYCVIDGAGSNMPNASTACISNKKGAVNFYPSCNFWTNKPRATNCTITNCGGYGIIYKQGSLVSFSGNNYSNNTLNNEQAF